MPRTFDRAFVNRRRVYRPAAYACLLACLASTPAALACGLHWKMPRMHFDAVQKQGRLSYHEDWGKLVLAEGLQMPLVVNFDSGGEWASPVLGRGWMLAFTDSHVIRRAENHYEVVMPDGYHYHFRRSRHESAIWKGNRGWLGRETSRGGFRAWAKCGWSIEWRESRIAKMVSPAGTVIDYRREGDFISEVRANGRPLLRLERDAETGLASALRFGAEKIELTFGPRPLVRQVGRARLIEELTSNLTAAKWSSLDPARPVRPQRAYAYPLDDGMTPGLEISSTEEASRLLQWDPQTRLILSDGPWRYAIRPNPKKPLARVPVTRTNAAGESEFWHREGGRGRSTARLRDGTKVVREWFVSGPARGRTRRVVRTHPDGSESVRRFAYREDGRILRRQEAAGGVNQIWLYRYGEDGRLDAIEREFGGRRTLQVFRPEGEGGPEKWSQYDRVTLAEGASEIAIHPKTPGRAAADATGTAFYVFDATTQTLTVKGNPTHENRP